MVYFSFLSTSGCLTTDNKQCIFPWTYSVDGSNHQGCANPDNDASGLWCPTLVDDTGTYQSDGSGNWGYCSDNCFTESGKNYRFITKNPCLWGIFSLGSTEIKFITLMIFFIVLFAVTTTAATTTTGMQDKTCNVNLIL